MRSFKRIISSMLILAMTLADPLSAAASVRQETVKIAGERLEDVPEGNYVYLGNSAVELKRGNGSFSVPVYREGDLSSKATVTIHTLDLTAVYGRDYSLTGPNKKESSDRRTLFERLNDLDENASGSRKFDVSYKLRTPTEYTDDIAADEESVSGDKTEDKIPETENASVSDASDEPDFDNYIVTGAAIARPEQGFEDIDSSFGADSKASDTVVSASADSKASADDLTDISDTVSGLISGKKKYIRKATPSEYADDEASEESGSADSVIAASAPVAASSGRSTLAELKEAQSGIPTREAGGGAVLNQSLTDQILAAILPDYMKEIPYSCEQVITFEPGESEAEIRFRTYADAESAGSKAFSIIITEADGAEDYKSTSLSVMLEDNSEVRSAISFDSAEYTADGNKAHITITRENAESSMASAVLTAVNETNGEKETIGEIAFLPFEMSKELDLTFSDNVKLMLTDLMAAEEGSISTAQVSGVERSTLPDMSMVMLSDSDDEDGSSENDGISVLADNGGSESSQSFDISIGSKKYTVRYDKGATSGIIYDTSYDPELAVGEYFFSTPYQEGGMFDYRLQWGGDRPNRTFGTLDEDYIISDSNRRDKNWREGYGRMRYYASWAWDKGHVWTSIQQNSNRLNTIFYSYLIPETAQESSFGVWGHETHFIVRDNNKQLIANTSKGGKYGQTFGDSHAVRIINQKDYVWPTVEAQDNCNYTPKVYSRFYGLAAMYKHYEVSIVDPAKASFKAKDGTVEAVPIQATAQCGAQILGNNRAMSVYPSADSDSSNMVFTVRENTVNGCLDKFGEITGYKITVGPDTSAYTRTTVNYPEDFISYIRNSRRRSTNLIDYGKKAVDDEVAKVTAHLDTVPFDAYFIDWIESVQNSLNCKDNERVISEGPNSQGYKQKLKFEPVVKLTDVKVTVVSSRSEGDSDDIGATFNDKDLKTGATVTYHAGDMLDLSATADSVRGTVTGYEVSTDGGTRFSSVRDTDSLVLRPGNVKGYVIRPLVTENKNRIEIRYASGSEGRVRVLNVVPQEALAAYPELRGHYYLDINPKASNIYERICPEPGKAYSIDVAAEGTPANGSVVRPVITDRMTGRKYNTGKYYFTARKEISDNVFVIGSEETPADKIKDYTLTGSVVSKTMSIRNDGLGLHANAAIGYTVEVGGQSEETEGAGKYVSVKTSSVSDKGTFTIKGLKGAAGDRITILADNGFNDAQVIEYTLSGSSGTAPENAGQLLITYPDSAPRVVSLTYDYDKAINRNKVNLNDNSVRCFDDTLTLTAVVDGHGRDVDEVVFIVRTVTGQSRTYHAKAKNGSSTVFEARIENMLDVLHNGDRVYAYIVDKEKRSINVGGQTETVDLVYPTVETGLVMYVQNELIMPKHLTTEYDNPKQLDIPLIGSPVANAESGVLSFTKTNYPDNLGYSVVVNLDAVAKGGDSPSTEDKVASHKKYSAAARRIAKEREYAAIKGNSAEAEAARQQIVNNLVEDDYDKKHPTQDHGKDQASGRKAQLNDDLGELSIDVEVLFCLDWEFVYDPVRDEYIMATFAGTVGGIVDMSKTWYTVISYVPCFLNLKAKIQVNMSMGWVGSDMQKAIAADDFDGYSGNIMDLNKGDDSLMWNIEGIIIGKAQVGAGICGVLSARGYISVTFDAAYIETHGMTENNYGLLVGVSGGIGFDLIVASINFDIASIQAGHGEFADRSKVSFLGGFAQQQNADEGRAVALSDDIDEESSEYSDSGDSEDGIELHAYSAGTSDLSSFGRNDSDDEEGGLLDGLLRSVPTVKKDTILLKNSAEHTRPKLIPLNESGTKQMMVFLAAADTEHKADSSCLYYSVYDNGSWSYPEPVNDNGTYDTTPDIIKMGDKVIIAWADARGSIDESETAGFKDKYNTFNIAGAVYDIKSDSIIRTFTFEDDTVQYGKDKAKQFFNLEPRLSVSGDTVYCLYLKRDLAKAEKEEDIAKLQELYSTMAYVTYDPDKDEEPSEERFIYAESEGQQDSFVVDYAAEAFTIEDEDGKKVDYIAAAYTVDTDDELKDGTDRDLYLAVYDVSNKKSYYPIRISKDNKVQSTPQLSELNGRLYLTWIEDGTTFRLMNVSDTVQSLMYSGDISDVYTEGDNWQPVATPGNYGDDWNKNDENWYLKAYEAIKDKIKAAVNEILESQYDEMTGRPEGKPTLEELKEAAAAENELEDSYETSVFGEIAANSIESYSIDISKGSMQSGGISEYSIATVPDSDAKAYDGNDIYIFYTDFSDDVYDTGRQLYAMRFRDPDLNDKSSESNELSEAQYAGGFTDPVMITDYKDQVIDEFDVCIDKNKNVYVIGNMYSQGIKNSKLSTDDFKLVYLYFEPDASVDVDEDSVIFGESLAAGSRTEISFNVRNNGLYDADGYEIKVEYVNGGSSKTIATISSESGELLWPGESKKEIAEWDVPEGENLSGGEIRITAREKKGLSGFFEKGSVTTKAIPYETDIVFGSTDVSYDGEKVTLGFDVTNYGNADMGSFDIALENFMNYDIDDSAELKRISIDGLKSGETKSVELSFVPKVSDFNHLGRIELRLAAVNGDTELTEAYDEFAPLSPVTAEIEDGAESISMKPGETRKLTVNAAPWNTLADEPQFSSSDGTVASVDEDGTVHALKNGEVIITAYYPMLGISTEIRLTVSGGASENKNSGSVRNRQRETTSSGGVSGNWSIDADGRWTFTAGGRLYKNEWAYIYNPYAKGDQEKYSWFRFDKDGYMLTGWYLDADGNRYYLWPNSDNLKGRMVTGWQEIDGKWYYFNPVSDGTRGAMYKNRTTPDGYKVGENGEWIK